MPVRKQGNELREKWAVKGSTRGLKEVNLDMLCNLLINCSVLTEFNNNMGLVIAGLSDMINIPADKISINQSTSLAVTGFIWARFSVTIIPVNYSLFAVNLFLGVFQSTQVFKAYRYQKQQALLEEQQKSKKND